MFSQTTGSKQVLVRGGYADFDSYGNGNYAMAATGNLDAPDYIPQGSVRIHNTGKRCPQLSMFYRGDDIGHRSDGPETAANCKFWNEFT